MDEAYSTVACSQFILYLSTEAEVKEVHMNIYQS